MIYSLTDKLKLEDNPQIEIMGKVITVKSDAETVLKLMDVVNNHGELEGAIKATELLFSEEDRAAIKSLNLNMADYSKLIGVAMSLAAGENPDDHAGE